ncbi:GGDEF domain-containing protein [[Pseudomonas] carboxydohydrogena]|uniref:diguanylate cyclase n=1 Tax=Afipia carboxydohydrogena TaxID=290 RepID=A0ABY8BWJ7_AFICR|nr:GGDEF domain-containing protein [[Pseudomonas] carboxydohydrogena]WEF52797.1 GGDEF domain-containing protein [[Pseudomonas] carboxydohydrogena]
MEAGTVFTTVSLMIIANACVLSVVSRDLPPALQPAARSWQIGTVLIAGGCAVFAFGHPLPRPVMLVSANALMALGLTAYYAAVQQFYGERPKAWQLLPAIVTTTGVLWFSVVHPSFQIRVVIVSIAWAWLMGASIWTLLFKSADDTSLSRRILIGLFAMGVAYGFGRFVIYLLMDIDRDFAVESGTNWLNLLSPIVMTLLPVVGTTAFLLMCSDYLRRRLEVAASTDYLTALPNRRMLARSGAKRFREARLNRSGFAVAVIDIDHFKAVNDTYGHDVGDQVLVKVADILRGHSRKNDIVARSGGEEFTVLLDAAHPLTAVDAIERMRVAVARSRFTAGSIGIPVTVSAGVATCLDTDIAYEDTFRRADQALYRAKESGRNRTETATVPLIEEQGASLAPALLPDTSQKV